jgi:peptidoglycan/xylan/chitin deacetylase (PgdA/CDA1 family)
MNFKKIDQTKLLRGQYEAEQLPKDFSRERIVPDFAFNVLNPPGLLYHPVVDEENLAKDGKKPVWPDGKSFAVCLTHDVDFIKLYSSKQAIKEFIAKISDTKNIVQSARAVLSFCSSLIEATIKKGVHDPLYCYNKWIEAEHEINGHSTFFFWPGFSNVTKHHRSDCTYELTDSVIFDGQKCTVAEMIREIDHRGWEIGLHPSWYSYDDVEELKRQKEALDEALGHDVISVRQHYLHYDIRVTPLVHAEAGLRFDSTLGFNDNVGFRFGTCHPWNLYDIVNKKELSITEVPLVIQDGAMLNRDKGMRLDEDNAFLYINMLAEAVENVGGVLTLLWHPNSIIDKTWWNLYLRTLNHLQTKNVWFASIREIGEWWQNKELMD